VLERVAHTPLNDRCTDRIEIVPHAPAGIISLRPLPPHEAFREAVRAAYGVELPDHLAVVGDESMHVCGIRPTEWWLVLEDLPNRCSIPPGERSLGEAGIAIDLSDAVVRYSVSGPATFDFVTAGCALDVQSGALRPGRCARTRFAHVPVVLVGTHQGIDLYVGRSYRDYFETWVDSVMAAM